MIAIRTQGVMGWNLVAGEAFRRPRACKSAVEKHREGKSEGLQRAFLGDRCRSTANQASLPHHQRGNGKGLRLQVSRPASSTLSALSHLLRASQRRRSPQNDEWRAPEPQGPCLRPVIASRILCHEPQKKDPAAHRPSAQRPAPGYFQDPASSVKTAPSGK